MGLPETIADAFASVQTNTAVACAYHRNEQSAAVSAVIGRTTIETVDEFQSVLQWQTVDFLILANDLVLDGVAIEPKPGDRITRVYAGQTETYEVLSLGQSTPCFRWCDQFRQVMRIHTKRVAVT